MPFRYINLKLSKRERASLKNCPFCGGHDLECTNSMIAHYWISCNTCKDKGLDVAVAGKVYGVKYLPDKIPRKLHQKAKKDTIKTWNRRAS